MADIIIHAIYTKADQQVFSAKEKSQIKALIQAKDLKPLKMRPFRHDLTCVVPDDMVLQSSGSSGSNQALVATLVPSS